jgi:hypothetical protein
MLKRGMRYMAVIEVDFEVYKELTARRATETVSYNDVIRSLLGLAVASPAKGKLARQNGIAFKGVVFPEGTMFRATHKGQTHTAQIKDGAWRDSDGKMRNSPSEAAVKITGKHWNGWRFWYCLRPGDAQWTLIDKLRQASLDELA